MTLSSLAMRAVTVLIVLSQVAAARISPPVLTRSQEDLDNTRPAGVNIISHDHTFTTNFLGLQLANNSASHRDLGFTGQLGGRWYAVYGDVLWCAPGVTDPAKDSPGFHGMVRDAISLCTDDPLVVHDLHLDIVGRQQQFIPFHTEWGETGDFGFGGTSLVEVDSETNVGAVFYLVVKILPGVHLLLAVSIELTGSCQNGNKTGYRGAGIAKVQLLDGIPTVTHRFGDRGYWWDADSTARYGDVAAFRDPRSEYIYAWGGAPMKIKGWVDSSYVYQCRVKATEAFDLARYEYWWGRQMGWKSESLTTFTAETAVMWMSGQGQVVWNDYLGCYVFVRLGPLSNDVLLRTAPLPEGPWSDDVKVFTATPIGQDGMTYAGVAHPYLDPSGRSMVISYTNNNNIEVIKVAFD
ncbi:hypothetical protein PG994_005314 [Apiospora phragmitis]|uniref:DUF4185 domain-containing protein n=1 Tax=Apiospora phragmitis TaxID=2905665 RepID=A0ABR1VBW1_9PEZI